MDVLAEDPRPRAPKAPQLQRVTFRTSRLLDFCSQKELTAQTGHHPNEWPLVIVKELVDNALDACEEAGVAPRVTVTVHDDEPVVADKAEPPTHRAGELDGFGYAGFTERGGRLRPFTHDRVRGNEVRLQPDHYAGGEPVVVTALEPGEVASRTLETVELSKEIERPLESSGRTADFLNWALVDTGSFDYAADAWGFPYGAAVEWYFGPWTLRGGFFDLSIVPNSTDLDPTFVQHQLVGEVERRYKINDQPGKLAITGFLTQGRMGAFEDAIKLAELTGQPADIAAVRRYQNRAGISFNLEQQLSANVGFFARGGMADGRFETFEFTDIDRTVAAGLVFSANYGADRTTRLALPATSMAFPAHTHSFSMMAGSASRSGTACCPIPVMNEFLKRTTTSPCYLGG